MKKYSLVVIVSVSLFSCVNPADYDIICNTDFTEETETLYFEGNYGDIDRFFEFEIYKHKYSVEISFDQKIIDSYKNAVRTLSYYVNETPPTTEDFYNVFLNDDKDLYLLQGILETLRNRTIGTDYDIVQMIVGFVQSIPYDEYAEDVRYPYETLSSYKGDCDEKSLLLCKLLNLEGYNSCLFVYPKEKHMAVGLKVSDEGYYKNGYVFIESTNTFPIGKKGTSADEKGSSEEPLIIFPQENDEGYYEQFLDIQNCYEEITAIYGDMYLQNNITGKILLEKMNKLKKEQDSKGAKLDQFITKMDALRFSVDSLEKISLDMNCSNATTTEIYNDCVKIINKRKLLIENFEDLHDEYEINLKNHNKIILSYNKLVAKFNKMNKEEKSPNTRTMIDTEF